MNQMKLSKITITEYFNEEITNIDNGNNVDDVVALLLRAKAEGYNNVGIHHEYDSFGEVESSTIYVSYDRDETDAELEERQKNHDEWEKMPKPILVPRSFTSPYLQHMEGGGYSITIGGFDIKWPE